MHDPIRNVRHLPPVIRARFTADTIAPTESADDHARRQASAPEADLWTCGDLGPWSDHCTRSPGHPGDHRGGLGSSWGQR